MLGFDEKSTLTVLVGHQAAVTSATLGWASKGEVSSQVLWTTGARPEEVSEADAQRDETGRVGMS